ncbi:MAG: hypothetical protein PHP75_04010 [Methylacidiphilaceae bacterium]|nr:hypothetical protein [Candidatus Methylacidiphilaceae bacterium]
MAEDDVVHFVILEKTEEADRRGEAVPSKLPEEFGRRQRLKAKPDHLGFYPAKFD